MSDPFEMLRSPDHRAEPDQEFRVRLMRSLDRVIDTHEAEVSVPTIREMTLSEAAEERPTDDGRPRHYFTVLVAAAAVLVALASVVMVRHRDTGSPPLNEQPSTVPFDPVREAEIATSMLLDAGEEYAPGWTGLPFKELVLDASLAETVSGCGPFLDSVFESSGRAAVTSYRSFNWFPPPAITGQYVVVFPSEDGAEAMFDATVDPRFGEKCLPGYQALAAELGGSCCDAVGIATPAMFGEPIEYDAEAVRADDIQVRVVEDAFWTDDDGVAHGPEQFREVTLRVGRAIIVMDALIQTATGDIVISADQFDTAITNSVDRARATLDQADN